MNIPIIISAVLWILLLISLHFVLRRGEEWKGIAEGNRKVGEELKLELETAKNNYEEAAGDIDQVNEALKREHSENAGKVSALTAICDSLRKQLAQNREDLEQLHSARNVAWTRPPRRMPANEVKRAFAVDESAPLWVALNQEIDDWLQGLFDEVSKSPSPTLTESHRLHIAGGIEEIRELQKRLLELQAAAQKVDADLDGEAPAKGGAS